MIQLSDIKAAPGLGGLLAQKPNAGGDASAFALALGSLAADGKPGTLIAFPRQPPAATGSFLPDGEATDTDRNDEPGPDTPGLTTGLLTVFNDAMFVPPASDAATLARNDATPTDATIIASGGDGSPRTSDIADLTADTGTVEPTTRRIASPSASQMMDAAPKPVSVAPVENEVATPVEPRTLANPPAATPRASAATVPDAPVALATTSVVATGLRPATLVSTAPEPAPAHPVRIAAPNEAPHPAPSSLAVGAAPKSAPPPIVPVEGSPDPVALAAVAGERPVLSSRLEATPTTAKPRADFKARPTGAEVVSPTSTPSAALATASFTRTNQTLPPPAKFVVADHAIDAPSEPTPLRRVTIAPSIPVASVAAAIRMTAADLIPVQHRSRNGAAPIAPVTDPATLGLSAPVDAASRIADPAPIDTGRADWIEGMIEQIDVMRDARPDGASATTRIRLAPDALGAIEIMLTAEGEAIDVRINAETVAARTLLADAAPRLTDMAEARGLRLAQGDGGDRQGQRQPTQDQPTANRRHGTGSAATGGNTDERIA